MRRARLLPLAFLFLPTLAFPATTAVPISLVAPVAAPAGSAPPPQLAGLPYVSRIYTRPEQPNPHEPTSVILEGEFPYRCGEVVRASAGPSIQLALQPRSDCAAPMRRWRQEFPLGMLVTGNHVVAIRLFVAPPAVQNGEFSGTFEFTVSDSDTAGPPPPPPGRLPFVDSIRIVPKSNGHPIEQPICPTDSLLFLVDGSFPSDCFWFRRIEVLPIYTATGFAATPINYMLRVVVDDGGCLGRPCADVVVPWQAATILPPVMEPGRFAIEVSLAQVTCDGPIPPGPLPTTSALFAVDSCVTPPPPPSEACVLGTFVHNGPPGSCDAFVSPGRPAGLTFAVHSTIALAGLQGRLRIGSPGLRFTRIATTGAASGMHLRWEPAPDGAQFVLLAENGAPIAPSSWPAENRPVPVLKVMLEEGSEEPGQSTWFVRADELIGADIAGRTVPMCLVRDVTPARMVDLFSARICAERDCDFNADGRVDVGDLVLMVHCWNESGPCPDAAGAPFDCNGDQAFTLDDVLCCATRTLGRWPCPGCPADTSHHRPGHGIGLSLGSPVHTPAGFDVPIKLQGAHLVGGARIVLEYPSDRFEVSSVEFPGIMEDWLHLSQARGGEVVLGLIRTAPPVTDDLQVVDAVIHLALRAGEQPGGEITVREGEFNGHDGVSLDVEITQPPLPLGRAVRVSLSAARPNPFLTGTTFALSIDQSSDVDVGVYDASGRLVASLYQDRFAAGTREFSWNGARSDGSPASSGIYFCRAAARDQVVSRKMILLRGN